ncbi:MAG: hypothetical protein JXQ71_17650 [Verrucomicrobia bacterium]|nr:hypothetical protein [Verrucomicrobiota bacterium]
MDATRRPGDTRRCREGDPTPWTGMPAVALDAHTLEGRKAGRTVTLLSGHYANHRLLGRRVMAEDWIASNGIQKASRNRDETVENIGFY